MEYSKEDLMEAKKQIWGMGQERESWHYWRFCLYFMIFTRRFNGSIISQRFKIQLLSE